MEIDVGNITEWIFVGAGAVGYLLYIKGLFDNLSNRVDSCEKQIEHLDSTTEEQSRDIKEIKESMLRIEGDIKVALANKEDRRK